MRVSQARQEKINQLVVSETAELIKIKEEIANFRIVIPNLYKTEIQDLLKK
ncbi:hypothetical protein CAPN005_02820 [Capnocytophaga cynodegmi]|nr:hypothetical protein CAPN005_02820 [Capnocytophaga cynodegmi]